MEKQTKKRNHTKKKLKALSVAKQNMVLEWEKRNMNGINSQQSSKTGQYAKYVIIAAARDIGFIQEEE